MERTKNYAVLPLPFFYGNLGIDPTNPNATMGSVAAPSPEPPPSTVILHKLSLVWRVRCPNDFAIHHPWDSN